MHIAFCSSEVFPFAKTGGLADVSGALPLALEKLGIQISIFLPRYKTVDEQNIPLEQVHRRASKSRLGRNVDVYLIEKDHFFNREGFYGDEEGDYPDNLERFQYFCTEILDLFKELNLAVDIVHCHDWQTALIPVYLKEKYANDPFYKRIKSLLTIHNLAYQGIFPAEEFSKLELPRELFVRERFEFYGQMNLLKAGIADSDAVSTVSPRYAQEILTEEFGCGLDGVLRSRKGVVAGILNGLDETLWDPQTDPWIAAKYSAKNIGQGKSQNKAQLQKKLNLPAGSHVPIFSFVGRLAHQKGLDLILEALERLLAMDLQIIVQGLGGKEYKEALKTFAEQNPWKMAVCFEFDEPTAHQIYAGSDFFLMPSQFEPCGLSQMISMHYGTIPVVFRTGGLADTVSDYDAEAATGNGFVFEKYSLEDFMAAMQRAVENFAQEGQFHRLRENALRCRFLWDESAREYQKLYQCLLSD